MYTVPDARRRGVSRAILLRLEEIAAELGYERIQLETGTAQPEALALYESQGWERIEPYRRYKAQPPSPRYATPPAAPLDPRAAPPPLPPPRPPATPPSPRTRPPAP